MGHLHSFCLGVPLQGMGTREHFCTYVVQILSFQLDCLSTLSVCFLAIVPLEKLFDYGGEQLAMYCGDDLGDLIVITLNKYARVFPSLTYW